ncbi:MAG: hypothetical protein JSS72_11615 [Armatimonadetes bacterium]|nr:hypothetical protein [Armatimonadota bacterium]
MGNPAGERVKALTAHVVYFDRVNYSLLPIEQQIAITEELNSFIRSLPTYQEAVASEEVISLDSGDGAALIFLRDPQQAADVALAITEYSRGQTTNKIRVGMNSGPVTIRTDLMGKPNATGSGIDLAARVQSLAKPDVLYLSLASAQQLHAFESWRPNLVDMGVQLVKHAEQIHVYAFKPEGVAIDVSDSGTPIASQLTFKPEGAAPIAQAKRSPIPLLAAAVGVVLAGLLLTRFVFKPMQAQGKADKVSPALARTFKDRASFEAAAGQAQALGIERFLGTNFPINWNVDEGLGYATKGTIAIDDYTFSGFSLGGKISETYIITSPKADLVGDLGSVYGGRSSLFVTLPPGTKAFGTYYGQQLPGGRHLQSERMNLAISIEQDGTWRRVLVDTFGYGETKFLGVVSPVNIQAIAFDSGRKDDGPFIAISGMEASQ